jgi:CheY-like chemotaxis protein
VRPSGRTTATAGHGLNNRPPRLLLVEDDDDSAALFTSYAEHIGHQVIRAKNGEDAVHIAKAARFDLAVVDLLLPGVSGWDVVTALLSGEKAPHCPVVVCSVLDRHDYPKNVQGVLPKPYTRRQVEQILKRLLPRAGDQ